MNQGSDQSIKQVDLLNDGRSPLAILTAFLENGNVDCPKQGEQDIAISESIDLDSGFGDIDLKSPADGISKLSGNFSGKESSINQQAGETPPSDHNRDTEESYKDETSCESESSIDDLSKDKTKFIKKNVLQKSLQNKDSLEYNETEPKYQQKEKPDKENVPSKSKFGISRSLRKSSTPRRSPNGADPRFKGATVWLRTSFNGEQSNLHVSAFYSNVRVRPRRRRINSSTVNSPEMWSGSDTEEHTPTHSHETTMLVKTCASCRTRRTPLWRDAEDGTPLCNACGIRYKKYRLRCSRCWHIPKKDIKTYPNCPCCGAALRFSFSRRAW